MTVTTDRPSPRVLFIHGLEGSPTGTKAQYLRERWGAYTPQIPSDKLKHLRATWQDWQSIPPVTLKDAVQDSFDHVFMAIRDYRPDIVIGSSMGGALAMKALLDGVWNGPTIFLNPAIFQLLREDATRQRDGVQRGEVQTVWILGTEDDITPCEPNLQACAAWDGTAFLVEDGHRLNTAVTDGHLDDAIELLWYGGAHVG